MDLFLIAFIVTDFETSFLSDFFSDGLRIIRNVSKSNMYCFLKAF